MELEARGIIIYKSVAMAEELITALLPEVKLPNIEVRRTLLKGLQSFREGDFDICFISDSFTLEELKPFFSDVRGLQKDSACVFVQVRDALEEGIQRASLLAEGITTIINHGVLDGDKAALADALAETLKKREIQSKRIDVESAMNLLMLEIDRVAKDRKRGIERQYSRDIVSGYVTDQLDFHSEVMDGYLKALESLADKGAPTKELIVELPESLLRKNLPGIVSGEYAGASLRVWEMLREKFGREVGSEKKSETRVVQLEELMSVDDSSQGPIDEDHRKSPESPQE